MPYAPPKEILDCIYEDVVGTALERETNSSDVKQYGERSPAKIQREKKIVYPYHCLDFTFFTIQKLKERGFNPILVVDKFKLPSRNYFSEHAVIEINVMWRWHTVNFQEGIEGRPHLIIHQGRHEGMFFEGKNMSVGLKRIRTEKFTPQTTPKQIVPEMVTNVKNRLPARLARGDLEKNPQRRLVVVHFKRLPIK